MVIEKKQLSILTTYLFEGIFFSYKPISKPMLHNLVILPICFVNQCIFIVLKINKDIETSIVLHIIIFILLMNFCSAYFQHIAETW